VTLGLAAEPASGSLRTEVGTVWSPAARLEAGSGRRKHGGGDWFLLSQEAVWPRRCKKRKRGSRGAIFGGNTEVGSVSENPERADRIRGAIRGHGLSARGFCACDAYLCRPAGGQGKVSRNAGARTRQLFGQDELAIWAGWVDGRGRRVVGGFGRTLV
jgi:hypothetical protein